MEQEPKIVLQKSESIKELATALSKFQGEVVNAKKESENPFFKSKYASLDGIVDTIRGPLSKNGLSYSQWPLGRNQLITILMHSSGEFMQGLVEMTPKDTSPQAHGSVITYMRRYSLSAILGIATEDDDDGNEASKPGSTKTIVKNEKVGAGDIYPATVMAIEKAKTQKVLLTLADNVDATDKLTDTQKDALQKMISRRVDELEVTVVPEPK